MQRLLYATLVMVQVSPHLSRWKMRRHKYGTYSFGRTCYGNKVLERFGDYTYIQCELETGRKPRFQIRVHMASIGHPLLGDEVYGPKKCPFKGLQGQTLHARTLGIIHPSTGEYLEVNAPLPEYFIELGFYGENLKVAMMERYIDQQRRRIAQSL